MKNVAKVVADGYEGAEILGIHFEGPYLDMVYKGAQPEQCIVKPDVEQFKRYQKAADGLIKIITMATERDEDFELTRYCAANDVRVSIGHSAATIEEAGMAIANGATSMTHIFNGMTPFHHRKPGLVGAAMRFRDKMCIRDRWLTEGGLSQMLLQLFGNLFAAVILAIVKIYARGHAK